MMIFSRNWGLHVRISLPETQISQTLRQRPGVNENLARLFIDISHQLDLFITLLYILLIDTDSVNPQGIRNT
jgi:hypothetical protein